jgi:RHS repeat-associated protein
MLSMRMMTTTGVWPELASGDSALAEAAGSGRSWPFALEKQQDAREIVPNMRQAYALYYYRARYYHPRLQRFVSEDPIGFSGGDMNLYAYVENDPVNLADPWGLQAAIPFPSAPIPLPLPPIAIPGSPQNQQAVQATAEALRQLQNSVGALGNSLEDLLIMMAQRGQQNIDNEFSRQARLQPDPCGWLRQQYSQAQDPITRLKIKAAQKFLGCRKSRAGKDCE